MEVSEGDAECSWVEEGSFSADFAMMSLVLSVDSLAIRPDDALRSSPEIAAAAARNDVVITLGRPSSTPTASSEGI